MNYVYLKNKFWSILFLRRIQKITVSIKKNGFKPHTISMFLYYIILDSLGHTETNA
jgi:hypothetical protein